MPRIQGVDIPNDKPTFIALQYLYGVGSHLAFEICHAVGVDPQAGELELGMGDDGWHGVDADGARGPLDDSDRHVLVLLPSELRGVVK